MKLKFDEIVHGTDKATLFRFDEEEAWLPLSQIEVDTAEQTVEVADWLVEKKGLEAYAVEP